MEKFKMSGIDFDDFEDSRCEKKFVVEELKHYEIEQIIRHHPAFFSEVFYERRINNIYFDSADLKNYFEHVGGIGQRLKIRIRWYGELFGKVAEPVLEIKIKNNEFSKKISFPLKSFKLDKSFSLEIIQYVFNISDLPKWLLEDLKMVSPSLLNSYRRKYFISADERYRVTIDKDMIFFKIHHKNNLFLERQKKYDECVLEIKYAKKDYDGVEKIGNAFPFRLIARSKYVYGVDLLDL